MTKGNTVESVCEELRQAILRLPRGAVRERLFVSLLKAIGHLSARRFALVEKIVSNMQVLAEDPVVTDEVTAGLIAVRDQLTRRVSQQEDADR